VTAIGGGRPADAAGPPLPPADLGAWTVAVVGLGTMGAAMAERLVECGAAVRAYTRSAARTREFVGRFGGDRPVRGAATPAQASSGADLVLVSVADDAALRDVLDGPHGVFAAADPPRVVLNASTVAPETVRELAGRGPLLDAGALGNGRHARGGRLRWYVGGSGELLAAARPVLDALGHQVLHVGGTGDGMVLKLAMNQLMGLEMQALAEVVLAAEAGGLDRRLVLDAVAESGFAAPVMRFKAARMAAGSYRPADFRLVLMAKDLALAVAAGGGARLPLTETAERTHAGAVAAGLGEADCAAVLVSLERRPVLSGEARP
jgi:3-hydroxyisobutyrate dehydrogenase-like beta-hydroxyacid dehydrogenase